MMIMVKNLKKKKTLYSNNNNDDDNNSIMRGIARYLIVKYVLHHIIQRFDRGGAYIHSDIYIYFFIIIVFYFF